MTANARVRKDVLPGRDDVGVEKRGLLWKRTSGFIKHWKHYRFEITRLCFICYKLKPKEENDHKRTRMNNGTSHARLDNRSASVNGTANITYKSRVLRKVPKFKVDLGDISSVEFVVTRKGTNRKQFVIRYGSNQEVMLRSDSVDTSRSWVEALKPRASICRTRKKVIKGHCVQTYLARKKKCCFYGPPDYSQRAI